MPYIGNQPQYTSFLTDTFSGNGSTTVFTMSVAPVNTAAVLVALSGVLQNPADYAVVGRILTFSSPPPSGVGNISIRYLALPASNVVSTAYRSVTEFTATAGQTTFTPASYTPGFIDVFRSGVRLSASNYVATNGVTVVLNNAAAAGDLITIESFFVSSVLNAIPNVSGAISSSLLDVTGQVGTGAIQFPSGTTAQRPLSPTLGMQRYNSTIGFPEFWNGIQWVPYGNASPPTVAYLVVAGGGGGGHGGGGAGGLLFNASSPVTAGLVYTVTVGAGGAGGQSGSRGPAPAGGNGNNSVFGSITAIGGGGGSVAGGANAGNGGSGGGQGGDANTAVRTSGTAGQGNGGGRSSRPGFGAAGGGGGAGAVGSDATEQSGSIGQGGNGGVGLQYSISGSNVFYAGGGGGGANLNTPDTTASGGGVGGAGGGGSGGLVIDSGFRAATTPNTGGGGGGAEYEGSIAGGGAGASGIVIISYSTIYKAASATGAFTFTSVGGNYIYTFTGSGTITF
jgi:hypothetical protein